MNAVVFIFGVAGLFFRIFGITLISPAKRHRECLGVLLACRLVDGDGPCTQDHVLTPSEAREPSLLVQGMPQMALGYPKMSSARGKARARLLPKFWIFPLYTSDAADEDDC